MPREKTLIEVVEVPASVMDLARRRTRPLLLNAVAGSNVLEVVMASCYLQGLEDGFEVATNKTLDSGKA